MGKVKSLLKGLKLAHLAPETPAIANMLTGEVMGHSADRLADRFGVSRADQDAFAARSHVNAAKAHEDGIFKDEIVPVNGQTLEEGIRGDSTVEKMAKLKPAFVKPYGSVTAASASYFTDGAACTLIMSEDKAKALGLTPKAYLREYAFPSCDPFECCSSAPRTPPPPSSRRRASASRTWTSSSSTRPLRGRCSPTSSPSTATSSTPTASATAPRRWAPSRWRSSTCTAARSPSATRLARRVP